MAGCLTRGAECLHMVQLMPLHPKTPSSLASFKSRLVLFVWYWLNQVVVEKRPLNGWSSGGGDGGANGSGSGFTFLVPSYPGCHGKEAVKRVE